MVSGSLIRRSLRRLHSLVEIDPIPEELRGWAYDRPPVKPRAYLGLGVSELAYASACGYREMWARRRAGKVLERTRQMELGLKVHEVFHKAAGDLRRLLARGIRPWDAFYMLYKRSWSSFRERWALDLYRMLLAIWSGEAASLEAYYGGEGLGWLPWLSEYRIDGTPLGLSKSLRADAVGEGGIVVEIKLGRPAHWHKLSVAGYALAIESYLEVPTDYGILIWVNGVEERSPRISMEPVYISPGLREEFLSVRDEAIEVLLGDEEPPSLCR